MKLLVFDTETTGLYNKKEKDLSKQPHIIQWASVLIDMDEAGEFSIIRKDEWLIKPPVVIPFEASQIHHIYDIDLIGKPSFINIAKDIQELVLSADAIVGHNIEFDENMVRIEFNRLKLQGLPFDFAPKSVICTMNEGTNWCRLPKKNEKSKGWKRPKLQELCKKALGKGFFGAHNAMVDVEWTTKCLSVMVKWGIIKLNKFDNSNKLTLF